MNSYTKNNYYDDIARGQISRYTSLKKFGIANVGTDNHSIWNGPTTLYVHPTTAITFEISSTDDDHQVLRIYGLDKNWKLQEEDITLNGTNGISTEYEYLRIFRMKVISGGNLVGNVSAVNDGITYAYIDAQSNQTQMAIYSVAKGHNLYIHQLDMGVLSKNFFASLNETDWADTDNPATRVISNTNLYRMTHSKKFEIPMKISGGSDIEGRGYVDSDTDDATYEFCGYIEQVNSVPVDITSYNLTGGDTEISVEWDEQTPAETSDLKYFEVGLYIGDTLIQTEYLSDKDSNGLVFENLDNNTTYTIKTNWVGYDGKKGDTVILSATPQILPDITNVVLASATDMYNGAGSLDGQYYMSTDSGETFDKKTLNTTGFDIYKVAVIDNFALLLTTDGSEYGKLYKSTDIRNWIEVLNYDGYELFEAKDKIFRTNATSLVESSSDGETWSEVTGLYNSTDDVIKSDDTYYIATGSNTVMSSSDGIAFTDLTNQPTNVGKLTASSTRIMTSYSSVTHPTYEWADVGTAWTIGGTSITASSLVDEVLVCYYNGLFHSIMREDNFTAGYYETSPDGITWTNQSSLLPTNNIPMGITTDGSSLYISLADTANNLTGGIITLTGTTWTTKVEYTAGIISFNMSGRD